MSALADLRKDWPALEFADWAPTAQTLHMWTQIVGKVRMALTPAVNHWWHVPLYVSPRGLTTTAIPDGARTFEIEFNFLDHRLDITCSDGGAQHFALTPMAVADFHAELMAALARIGVAPRIWTTPCEVPAPIPFEQDRLHRSYDAEAVSRFFRVLVQVDRVMKVFRGRFLGKCSPVHFFWGSFDLAVTRFSGRPAPPHPGSAILPASVSGEAYSHEAMSVGFWPGDAGHEALFYAYAYPEPAGFPDAATTRSGRYEPELGEFVLPYAAVREAHAPDYAILGFFQRAYEAAADLAGWPRDALERRAP
ncbi:DUF5996 family protein [Phenylobacterium sp. J367]|uniref:DUF5996 family protein n=1 Tax=Phenylobacterium sp. J367 TaxID=2898435 RepID=UPI002150B961|nr:DUF5996 family protein [Phenylobacterium sp. J367]MCR5879087.1 DUF5996 family protein [Phenylobacterium sp. J367]